MATIPTRPYLSFTTETNRIIVTFSTLDTGGSAITAYRVRINEGSWIDKNASDTQHTFASLTQGTFYRIDTQSENSVGYSPIATQRISTTGPPPAFTLAATPFTESATLVITGTDDINYIGIEYRYTTGNTPGGTWTPFSDISLIYSLTGLTQNTQYTIQIRGTNVDGAGIASNTITLTTRMLPWETFWNFKVNDFFIIDPVASKVFNIPKDTPNNGTAVTNFEYDLPSNITDATGATLYENEIYVLETNRHVSVWNWGETDTPTQIRRFLLNNFGNQGVNVQPRAIVRIGEYLYVSGWNQDVIFVFPADAPNGETVDRVQSFNFGLHNNEFSGLAYDSASSSLFVVDNRTNQVHVISNLNAGRIVWDADITATITILEDLSSLLLAQQIIITIVNPRFAGNSGSVTIIGTLSNVTRTETKTFSTEDFTDMSRTQTFFDDITSITATGFTSGQLYVSTNNAFETTMDRTFNLPSNLTDTTALVVDSLESECYIIDASNDTYVVFDKDTADGTTATITRRVNLPSGLDNPRGVAMLQSLNNSKDIKSNVYTGIQVEDKIFMTKSKDAAAPVMEAFTTAGVAVPADDKDEIVFGNGHLTALAPFGKNRYLVNWQDGTGTDSNNTLYIADYAEVQNEYGAFKLHDGEDSGFLSDIISVAATPKGVLVVDRGDSGKTGATTSPGLYLVPYETFLDSLASDSSATRAAYQSAGYIGIRGNSAIAQVNDRIYVTDDTNIRAYTHENVQVETETFKRFENLWGAEHIKDISIRFETLYVLTNLRIIRINLEKTRLPKPKETIYPQISKQNTSIPLLLFQEGADSVEWADGYTAPSYLSIDSSYNLVIAANAVTKETSQLLKFKAKNVVGEAPFQFYLTLLADVAPKAKDVVSLLLLPGETYDLRKLFEGATTVTVKSGFMLPTGVTLAGNNVTLSSDINVSHTEIQLTATNSQGSIDLTVPISIDLPDVVFNTTDISYRLFIGGIDVTADMILNKGEKGKTNKQVFKTSESIDLITLNRATLKECIIILDNSENRYTAVVASNFWVDNNLDPDGYNVKVVLSAQSGSETQTIFDGVLTNTEINIADGTINLLCLSNESVFLNQKTVIGGLVKMDELTLINNPDKTYQSVYTPDSSLLPILPTLHDLIADKDLEIKPITNSPTSDLGSTFISDTSVEVRETLSQRPLLKFKTHFQNKSISFFIQKLLETHGFFNQKIDVVYPRLAVNTLQNFGNIAFDAEQTRITTIPTDWLYDDTHQNVYILLSNREAHVRDRFVRYDWITSETETLHYFPYGTHITQIATGDFDTFYFLAAAGGWIDSSEVPVSTPHEKDALKYDSSSSQGSTSIIRYRVSTDTETLDFVSSASTHPPQLATHYFVGFFNEYQFNEYQSTVPDNRSDFVVWTNELYYRYATPTHFGIAKVDSSGTITQLLSETTDAYHNAENFAFHLEAATGNIYWGRVKNTRYRENNLIKLEKRDSSGTITQLYSTAILRNAFKTNLRQNGFFSGIKEIFVHDSSVYAFLEIQNVRKIINQTDRFQSLSTSASAALVKFNSFNSPEIFYIKSFDFTHFAGRSFSVYDDAVFFMNFPIEAYQFKPINEHLPDYNSSLGYNDISYEGGISKIQADFVIPDVVPVFYDAEKYTGFMLPSLVIDGTLMNIIANNSLEALLQSTANTLQTQPLWFGYGKKLRYLIPHFLPKNTLAETFEELTSKLNSQYVFKNNQFTILNNTTLEAEVAGAGISGGTLPFKNQTRLFPNTGYLLANNEFLQYTGIRENVFTGIVRGILNSSQATHTDGDRIVYLDYLFDPTQHADIRIGLDTVNFYTSVQDRNNSVFIGTNKTKVYTLNIDIPPSNSPWLEFLLSEYYNRLSKKHYKVFITLKSHVSVNVNDIVGFYYGGVLLMPVRVISISKTDRGVHIIGRSI